MQGVASISGGRFFEGGDRSCLGDRRLRPLQQPQNHQSLKCPRCDSPNTKFCYYNNYNLSQPRHFCKSCRRYWTKGGVLRNVPVGGGCRKSKRSRAKNSSVENKTSSPLPATSTAIETPALTSSQKKVKSNSHSTSESSSLTNTASAATEVMSAPTPNTANHLLSMQESKFFPNTQSGMPHFEGGLLEQRAESGIFSDIGNLTSLITLTNEEFPFTFGNISDISPFRFGQQNQEHLEQSVIQQQKWMVGDSMGDRHLRDLKLPETTSGSSMIDQKVQVNFSPALQSKETSGASFGSLDWQGVGDQGLFDLPNSVDQTFWSQSQWTEEDTSNLYLP